MTRTASITRSRDPKGNGRTFQPVQRYRLETPDRITNASTTEPYRTPPAFYRNDGLKAIPSRTSFADSPHLAREDV